MRLHIQKGFTIVEFIIIAAILGVVGFVGYSVYDRQQNKFVPGESAQANDVSDAPAIENTSDLTSAESILDKNDPQTSNDADTAELDKNLSTF